MQSCQWACVLTRVRTTTVDPPSSAWWCQYQIQGPGVHHNFGFIVLIQLTGSGTQIRTGLDFEVILMEWVHVYSVSHSLFLLLSLLSSLPFSSLSFSSFLSLFLSFLGFCGNWGNDEPPVWRVKLNTTVQNRSVVATLEKPEMDDIRTLSSCPVLKCKGLGVKTSHACQGFRCKRCSATNMYSFSFYPVQRRGEGFEPHLQSKPLPQN